MRADAIIDGVLPIDKAIGRTSAHTVAEARKLFGGVKAGHAGTLDPAASGVLPVMLGEATGFIRFLPSDKIYRADIVFGIKTDTDDAEGEVIARGTPPHDLSAAVREVLPRFTGEYEQTAPTYSALKHAGRPMYYYARRNIPAPIKRRKVRTHELRVESVSGVRLTLIVRCDGGFYVRALARDIGETLRCGAHLGGLRRTRCASLNSASPLEIVAAEQPEMRAKYIAPVGEVLTHLPPHDINRDAARALGQGRELYGDGGGGDGGNGGDGARVRFVCGGRFAGVGVVAGEQMRGEKMMAWTREL